MKKFRFRLQKVLELKQLFEKSKQQEIADILKKLTNEKKALAKLMNERESYQQQRLQVEKKGSKLLDIRVIDQYLNCLTDNILVQKKIIERLEIDLANKQDELLKITKEKKILENYKESKREEYITIVLQTEQNFIDEMALFRNEEYI